MLLKNNNRVEAEYETDRQYPDIVLIPYNENKKPNVFIFEFKYAKVNDDKKTINNKIEDAKKQLFNYSNNKKFI